MEVLRKTYPIKVWQYLLNWILLLILVFGGIWGTARYASDQRKESARALTTAEFIAKQTSIEQARDQRQQCIVRVSSRTDLRGVLIGIFDYLDPGKTSPNVTGLRELLDTNYPELSQAECPPEPSEVLPPGGD